MAQIILQDILDGERDPIQVVRLNCCSAQAVTPMMVIMVADLGTGELQAGMQRLLDQRWFAPGAN